MYKRNFSEENAELCITADDKRQPIFTINGLSVSDWCEQKWQQLSTATALHRNRFFFHREEEKHEKTLSFPRKSVPLQVE